MTGAVGAVAGVLACALVLVLYALRGGSFDVVPRSELGIAAWWTIALGWAVGVLPRARLGAARLAAGRGARAAGGLDGAVAALDRERRAHGRRARAGGPSRRASSCSRSACCRRRTWRAAVAGAATGALIVCALAVASRLWPGAFPDRRASARASAPAG